MIVYGIRPRDGGFKLDPKNIEDVEVDDEVISWNEDSGEIETYSKKMTSQLMREKAKITRNLDGIRNMNKLPGAMVVIDANIETNALREATALRIPTIGLVDTDGDPELVDIPIPGNDDSLRSIEVVIEPT